MKITFSGPWNHSTEKFKYFNVTPSIDFVIDRQMEDFYGPFEGERFGGIIEYSIGFQWIVFSFYLNLEVRKKKAKMLN